MDVVVECDWGDDVLVPLPVGCTAADLRREIHARLAHDGGEEVWEIVPPRGSGTPADDDLVALGARVALRKRGKWIARDRLAAAGIAEASMSALQKALRDGAWAVIDDIIASDALRRADVQRVLDSALLAEARGTQRSETSTDRAAQLLAVGADPNAQDPRLRTPLILAARHNRVALCRLLADPSAPHPAVDINARDDRGTTAVSAAAAAGAADTGRTLLEAGADFDAEDARGMTPLAHAAAGGHIESVRVLLAGGASPRLADLCGRTALGLAAAHGHEDVVDVLLRPPLGEPTVASRESVDGRTPLMHAAAAGHVHATSRLLHGARAVNADAASSQPPHLTALMLAAMHGHGEVCSELLHAGASPDAPDACGRRALAYAADNGHVDVLPYFVHAKARLDAADDAGKTPLMCSAAAGRTRMAARLLEFGADLERRDDIRGCTALGHAISHGHGETCLMLLAYGAGVHARDALQRTPLILLACTTWVDLEAAHGLCTALLRRGADPVAADASGSTALDYAHENGHAAAARVLERALAARVYGGAGGRCCVM